MTLLLLVIPHTTLSGCAHCRTPRGLGNLVVRRTCGTRPPPALPATLTAVWFTACLPAPFFCPATHRLLLRCSSAGFPGYLPPYHSTCHLLLPACRAVHPLPPLSCRSAVPSLTTLLVVDSGHLPVRLPASTPWTPRPDWTAFRSASRSYPTNACRPGHLPTPACCLPPAVHAHRFCPYYPPGFSYMPQVPTALDWLPVPVCCSPPATLPATRTTAVSRMDYLLPAPAAWMLIPHHTCCITPLRFLQRFSRACQLPHLPLPTTTRHVCRTDLHTARFRLPATCCRLH